MKRRTICDALLVAGFLVGIATPLCDQVLGEQASVEVEFRLDRPAPALAWERKALAAFPAAFEAWFGDAFGTRDVLIRWHNVLAWVYLNASPTPNLVRGEEDWIFANWGLGAETFCGVAPFEAGALESWRHMLEQRRNWVTAQGAEYLFTLVPNKETVYPELFPSRYRKVGPSRREQFLAHMAEHSDVDVLDFLPPLLAEKASDAPGLHVYYRLGDHWNDRGGFAGARALVERLQRRFPTLATEGSEDYELLPVAGHGDSWAGRLYMRDVLTQDVHAMQPNVPRACVRIADPDSLGVERYLREASDLPSAVLFHDSFGLSILPFLSDRFSKLTAWRGEFDEKLVLAERPDVVIELFVERILVTKTPAPSTDGAMRALFDGARETAFAIDLERGEPRLDPVGDTRIMPAPVGIDVVTVTRGDLFYLPPFELSHERAAVLRMQVTSPVHTTLELGYQTRDEHAYSRARSYRVDLREGWNEVFVHVDVPDLRGRILVRPGLTAGRFVFHSIEARLVAR